MTTTHINPYNSLLSLFLSPLPSPTLLSLPFSPSPLSLSHIHMHTNMHSSTDMISI